MLLYERKPNPNQDYIPRTSRQVFGCEYMNLRSNLTFRETHNSRSTIVPIVLLIALLLFACTL